jgi:hypothetical protein
MIDSGTITAGVHLFKSLSSANKTSEQIQTEHHIEISKFVSQMGTLSSYNEAIAKIINEAYKQIDRQKVDNIKDMMDMVAQKNLSENSLVSIIKTVVNNENIESTAKIVSITVAITIIAKKGLEIIEKIADNKSKHKKFWEK